MKIHVVSHTHWDREWYRTFSYFDTRLSYFFDKLFKTMEDKEYKHFLLDGQMVMIEDYLHLYPQNKNKIQELVKAGKLIIGPWYTQPDEFAPDGESLIRNLLIGINMANDLGNCMLIGYLPDSFGHNAQIPQILKGFNIHSAVVMRGVPSDKLDKNEFIWKGLNNDEVLTISLTKGYSNGMFLPKDLKAITTRIEQAVADLVETGSTENVLIMNGVDHQFPQPHIVDFFRSVKDKENTYIHSTLEAYVNDIEKSKQDLPIVSGELISPVTNRVHSSIASTRMYQKSYNRFVETLIEKRVEPIATLSWLYGTNYPHALINKSWKLLLQNQIHDSICGCCIDEVHEDIDRRFKAIETTANTLLKIHSRAIAKKVSGDELSLVIFNDAFVKTKQIVTATVYTEKPAFELFDGSGNKVNYVIDSKTVIDASLLSVWTLYLGSECKMHKFEISFDVDFNVNYGYLVYKIKEHAKPLEVNTYETVTSNILENKFSRITINKNGTFDLLDKQTNHLFKQLNGIEDAGDAGDTYNYSPVLKDCIFNNSSVENCIYTIKKSANKTIANITYDIYIPLKLTQDDKRRSEKRIKQRIDVSVTLYENIQRIDIQTTVNNKALDHRLRVLFPTGLKSNVSASEIQFGTLIRPNEIKDEKNWLDKKYAEKPLPIYPQQKFVDVSDGLMGLAILNKNITEYEVYNKERAEIALTLFRGVGSLGKANLLVRPGRASGMLIPTPKAQCLGVNISEYSILVHQGNIDDAKIASQALAYNANPTVVQSALRHSGIEKDNKHFFDLYDIESLQENVYEKLTCCQKGSYEFIDIDSQDLLVSAIKKAEKENALIIRIYNPMGTSVEPTTIKVNVDIHEAFECDLLENSTKKLESKHQTFKTNKIERYSVQTYKLTFKS